MTLFAPKLEDFESYDQKKLFFRPRIRSNRLATPPLEFTAAEAEEQAIAGYGSPTYTSCESVTFETIGKAFFDWERYDADELADKAAILEELVTKLADLLDVERSDIAVAKSHGWVTKRDGGRAFKVSFRFYIQSISIKVCEYEAFFAENEEYFGTDEVGKLFDQSIYPKQASTGERVIRMVGACKGEGDTRVLAPLDSSRPYHHFLIQCLTGCEKHMVFDTSSRPAQRRRGNPSTSGGTPAWLKLSKVQAQLTALQALQRAGMTEGYRVVKMQNNILVLATEGSRTCMHGETHTSNGCSVVFQKDGTLKFVCLGTNCISKGSTEIGRWRDGLTERCSMDCLTDQQLQEFDPNVLKQLEMLVRVRACTCMQLMHIDFV